MLEKNIKYYRLKKNMTKKDLATACGVTQMTISHYESGKRKPDINMINKLAEALDVYVADFLATRNRNLSFQHGEFRKKSSLSKSQQEYVREYVEEYFSRFFTAVDALGGNPLPKPPKCNCIPVTGDYEKDAASLRTHLDVPTKGPIEDLTGLLENSGVLVIFMDIDNEKFSGMNGFVNEYPYIVIRDNMNTMRKRSTLVHELVHLMFNWVDASDIDEEHHATAVAGAFLITREDLFRELGLKKAAMTKDMKLVCKEYGISTILLVKRAEQVGIMSTSVSRQFYIYFNRMSWRTKEPEWGIRKEELSLFKQLVYRAINEEGLSIQKGAELLKTSRANIMEFCGPVEV